MTLGSSQALRKNFSGVTRISVVDVQRRICRSVALLSIDVYIKGVQNNLVGVSKAIISI